MIHSTLLRALTLSFVFALLFAGTSLQAEPEEPPEAVAPAVAEEALPPPAAMAAPAEGAIEAVDDLHAVLLDVMKRADELGYEGRAERLGPVIPARFDITFMARKSVGRHWKEASDEERRRFLDAFTRFMVANYAGQFNGYGGQYFETLGEEPARMETVLVKTKLVDPEAKETVELNYRMRQVSDSWKIVDVYMDGTVSELARRRSEFSSIVKREDFDALIAKLDEKIAKLAAES